MNIFWSNSNQFSVILIWSSELALLLQVVWVIKRLANKTIIIINKVGAAIFGTMVNFMAIC